MDKLEFIEIPELGIKVQKTTSGRMTGVKAEEYCKTNNAKMLTITQAGYIYDNNLIKDFCKEREWLEHYSQKAREQNLGCTAWNDTRTLNNKLEISGNYWANKRGYSFAVRLVLPLSFFHV